MKKVLVADDEDAVLALVRATLEDNERFLLLTARDGEEAVAIACKERPDLVFLDVRMPKMDGYEACRRLKSEPQTSHCTVVMLTAYAQEEDRKKARIAGADDYLTKPFSPTSLLMKVEKVLETK